MRVVPWVIVVLVVAGCAGAGQQHPPAEPPAAATDGATTAGALPDAAVAYVRAWAANDVATMVRNSAPDSPARGFAEYWGDVYAAGRLDSGQADVTIAGGRASLTYRDGTTYSVERVRVTDGGLFTWTASPGGPLAARIVAGPVVAGRAGGVTGEALRQYVNSDGDLRVSLRVRNDAGLRRDVFARRYELAGKGSTATVGSGSRTGVVQVAAGSTITALASVEQADPGGRLTLSVVDRTGAQQGWIILRLPR